jgi:hypothetical protein
MKLCPKCGSRYPDHANFCPKDGTRLEERDESAGAEGTVRKPGETPRVTRQEKPVRPDEATDAYTPEEEEKLKDDAGGFSDTQWFMAAVKPEDLKEATETAEVSDLQKKYERDEKIPEEDRNKFSLRKKRKK